MLSGWFTTVVGGVSLGITETARDATHLSEPPHALVRVEKLGNLYYGCKSCLSLGADKPPVMNQCALLVYPL